MFSAIFGFRGFKIPIVPVHYLLVVAGGGGGATDAGGGGGAGGVIAFSEPFLPEEGVTYTITVGAGGSSGYQGNVPTNGANSEISGDGLITQTAIGGGNGGSYLGGNFILPGSGGSGGGAGIGDVLPGSGIPGQGHDGGNNYSIGNCNGYGGGGGAGAVGGDGILPFPYSKAGNGGIGFLSSITGISKFYAGGGGGGGVDIRGTGGLGGLGGGGDGNCCVAFDIAESGDPNTGGGGGGALCGAPSTGGAGGSGVVIIRVATAAVSTTGSPTILTVDGDTVYIFTGTGSITF